MMTPVPDDRTTGRTRQARRGSRVALALLALFAPLALTPLPASAQPSYCEHDAARTTARVAVASSAVAGNVALHAYFKNAWWSGEKAESFWVNHDWGMAFRDQDKFGHALGGYHLARIGTDLLEAGCYSRRTALIWGSAYAAVFQLQVEIWDGYQAKYGFSPPDLLANSVGTGLFVAQELVPALRNVKPTFSYWPTRAYRRWSEQPGSELRNSIDYTGQTYWLSADIDEMLPAGAARWWPGILRLSVGHSITDWIDPATGRTVEARRRMLLSLDVDAAKLPGSHPIWVRVKRELGYIRFPAPALQIFPRVEGIAWHR